METYMHVKCKDVAFQVFRKVCETDNNSVWVVGRWINLGYSGKPWILTDPERIELKNRNEWVKIPQELLFKARTKEGPPDDDRREYL